MRLRKHEALGPEVERELDALDAALAGRPVDVEFAALADLARELRAERPTAGPGFTAELDAGAAEGFPHPERGGPIGALRRVIASRSPRRFLAPAGAVATLVVVVGVAISQSGGGGESALSTTAAEPAGSAATAAPRTDAAAPSAGAQAAPDSVIAEPPLDRDGLAPGQDDRKVEQAAQLTLSTDPDDVPGVADDVIGVTDRYGGIVVSSQVSGSEDEHSVARFDLAIPATELSDALADLSELADVSARSESTLDITEPFATARERLSDAHAELDNLLTQLAEAGTPRETRSIRARIEIVRGEIAQARSEVEDLARRARFARVSVTVEGDGGSGSWSLGDAADDALDVLRTIAGVGLVSLAVLAPLGLLAAIAWLIARGAARRRRERALD